MPAAEQNDPHASQPVLTGGVPLESAKAAMIMVHGRGADAESILMLAEQFDVPGFAFLAPQAAGYTWYPYPFMSPMEMNEPYLGSALRKVGSVLQSVVDAGIPPERIILLGFSQGACLATEFTARNARRYGGAVGFSGGLIGPDGTPRDYAGSMAGTPVFLGCSDVDPHIPKERVLLTAEVFERLGAKVDARLYANMPHTVNRDEIAAVNAIMEQVVSQGS